MNLNIDSLFEIFSDSESPISQVLELGSAVDRFQYGLLNGTLTKGEIEELADTFAQHEIEPYEYLDAVNNNINTVLNNQIDLVVWE